MSEKLVNLVNTLRKTIEDANITLESVEREVYPAWSMRKNRATSELPTIRDEYTKELRTHTIYLLVLANSSNATSFANVANEYGGAYHVSLNNLFQEYTSIVDKTLGTDRVFGPHQMTTLVRMINETETGLGLKTTYFDSMPGNFIRTVPTLKDTLEVVREIFLRAVDFNVVVTYLVSEANNLAIKSYFDKEIYPVVLTGLTPEVVVELSNRLPNHFVVKIADEDVVNKDLVFSVLKKIKNSLIKTVKSV
jgi:hypothetical protein